MIVVRTLFIYTHVQKHISVFILFRHAHKRNFLQQLKCSRLRNKSWQSDCRLYTVYSASITKIEISLFDDENFLIFFPDFLIFPSLISSIKVNLKLWRNTLRFRVLFSIKSFSNFVTGNINANENIKDRFGVSTFYQTNTCYVTIKKYSI